jgi:Txe/YoeB family toxin of Txe-Axe toxin-antitoxin module
MQFPLTPRQAWSNPSHLSSWAKIPWSFNEVTFTHGQVLIGNKNSVWLDHAYLRVLNWQKDKPAELTLLANFGLTPITARMRLQKQDKLMTWQKLSLQLQHANMFMLNDWLKISDLPQVQQGHCSLDISASRSEKNISGRIDLKLHHLHMISEQQPANYLKPILENPLLETPMKLVHIHTAFKGDGDWSTLAAHALISAVSRKNYTSIKKYPSLQTTYKHLGSLRIQQDIRLSLNERTRLRKIIKTLRHQKNIHIELTPDLGTAELTPKLKQQIITTQTVIQKFMQQQGIKRDHIYATLPQAKHHSTSDVGAVHINLVK